MDTKENSKEEKYLYKEDASYLLNTPQLGF